MERSNRESIAALGDVAVHTLGYAAAATELPVSSWLG
jgi:hypothetical protein